MELAQAVNQYDYGQLEGPPLLEVTEEQLAALADQHQEYHAIYGPYFSHVAQREHSYNYMRGLLDPEIKRKSAENIALATVGESGVRPLQSFVGQSRWSRGSDAGRTYSSDR